MDSRLKIYENAKLASIGDTIKCPMCLKDFEKRSHGNSFCEDPCKQKFWNKRHSFFALTPEKKEIRHIYQNNYYKNVRKHKNETRN